MQYRHLLQVVSPWIMWAPSPANQDSCAWARVDGGTHRSVLCFWSNTTEFSAAYAVRKLTQPTGCRNVSAGESSPQVCNNPSPNRGAEPDKEAQHCAASATAVLTLREVLSSGSSTPPHPSHQKAVGIIYRFEVVVSPVPSGKLPALLWCLQSHHARQTWKGKSALP